MGIDNWKFQYDDNEITESEIRTWFSQSAIRVQDPSRHINIIHRSPEQELLDTIKINQPDIVLGNPIIYLKDRIKDLIHAIKLKIDDIKYVKYEN